MSKRSVSIARIATVAAALMLAARTIGVSAGFVPPAAAAPKPAGIAAAKPALESLDFAFRFASAIKSDARDRAKAQELALGEYAAAGAIDEAAQHAPGIEGWRRGSLYASLATQLARAGRADEARAFIGKAEEVRRTPPAGRTRASRRRWPRRWCSWGRRSRRTRSPLASPRPIQSSTPGAPRPPTPSAPP